MKKLATLFQDSYHELFRARTLTLCAMFGALSIVLDQFTIKAGSFKLGISGLPNELVHFLFGPVVGATFGGAMDILKFLMKPDGGFFLGYTLTAITAGLIYGAFWYKRPLSLPRILAARLAVILVCNLFMNTLWISMTTGKAFLVLLPARAIKNITMWPVDSLLFFIVAGALERSGVFRELRSNVIQKGSRIKA